MVLPLWCQRLAVSAARTPKLACGEQTGLKSLCENPEFGFAMLRKGTDLSVPLEFVRFVIEEFS